MMTILNVVMIVAGPVVIFCPAKLILIITIAIILIIKVIRIIKTISEFQILSKMNLFNIFFLSVFKYVLLKGIMKKMEFVKNVIKIAKLAILKIFRVACLVNFLLFNLVHR